MNRSLYLLQAVKFASYGKVNSRFFLLCSFRQLRFAALWLDSWGYMGAGHVRVGVGGWVGVRWNRWCVCQNMLMFMREDRPISR